MFILLIIIITLLFIFAFKRYVPIKDVKCISLFSHCQLDNAVMVDVRDYNESSKDPIDESINIPIAYLNRYYREVPDNKDIIIVSSDKLERNMAIRFFRKSGYKVVGYLLLNERTKSAIKGDYYGLH
jgi:rhodanese-related sulfurtransferase